MKPQPMTSTRVPCPPPATRPFEDGAFGTAAAYRSPWRRLSGNREVRVPRSFFNAILETGCQQGRTWLAQHLDVAHGKLPPVDFCGAHVPGQVRGFVSELQRGYENHSARPWVGPVSRSGLSRCRDDAALSPRPRVLQRSVQLPFERVDDLAACLNGDIASSDRGQRLDPPRARSPSLRPRWSRQQQLWWEAMLAPTVIPSPLGHRGAVRPEWIGPCLPQVPAPSPCLVQVARDAWTDRSAQPGCECREAVGGCEVGPRLSRVSSAHPGDLHDLVVGDPRSQLEWLGRRGVGIECSEQGHLVARSPQALR